VAEDVWKNRIVNVGNPTLVISNGAVGVDLVLFYIRKYTLKSSVIRPADFGRILLLHCRSHARPILGILTHSLGLRLVGQIQTSQDIQAHKQHWKNCISYFPADHSLSAATQGGAGHLYRFHHNSGRPV
jgi:hypothetical protein